MTPTELTELELDLRRRLTLLLDSGIRLAVVETIDSTNAQLKAQAVMAISKHSKQIIVFIKVFVAPGKK